MFPVYTHAVWKLVIPPRVQFFQWLLSSHNRILTRVNLKKRSDVSDPTCLFCNELESITHLFFDCCVAMNVWKVVTEVIDVNIGSDYESIARLWVANKKFFIANVISSAILWSLWKLRNEICFQEMVWTGMRMVHDQNCKDVKGLAFAVQAGGCSGAGRADHQDGRIVKVPDTDRMEGGDGNGYIITTGSIGVSVFSSCQK